MTKEEQRGFERILSKLAARASFCAVEFAELDKEGVRLTELISQVEGYSAIPPSERQYVVRIADRFLMVFASPWWNPKPAAKSF